MGVATNAAGDTYRRRLHQQRDRTNPSESDRLPDRQPAPGRLRRRRLGRLRLAHRQRRRPAADQDRVAGAGDDERHPDLHADDQQPLRPIRRSTSTLADPLPAGMTFATCVADAGGVCGGSGNNRTVTLRVASPGLGSATVTITATVTAGMGATLVNTATVALVDLRPVHGQQHRRPRPRTRPASTRATPTTTRCRTTGRRASASIRREHRRQRRRRRSRRRRPDQLPGVRRRLAPARLRDHLSRGRRDRHVLRHAHRARQPDGDAGARAVPLPEGRRHGGVRLPHDRCRSAALTIDVDGVASMASAAFSSLIEADVQVVADRTMTWGTDGYGSHAERGVLTRTGDDVVPRRGRHARHLRSLLPDPEPGPAAAQVEITYLRPSPRRADRPALHGRRRTAA